MDSFHTGYDAQGIWAIMMYVALGAIVSGYLVIAFQFWRARRRNSRAAKALGQLLAIFIFCAFSGYMPRLVIFADELFVVVHVVLALLTWWYIASRQAIVIAEAMNHDDRT